MKLRSLLVCVLLVLATFIAYEPGRHNEFTSSDDVKYVTKNPQVQAGLTTESVVWAFTSGHAANWHPLTWLSHMLDCELFGVDAFWHHLTNLLFHTVNTLLLFWILKNTTGAVWPSAFVAGAFALHPLHVESVAWAAERKDVLSGFFWMLTMATYIRYARHPGVRKYLLVALVFGLGLMAKPMLVTLPFVLLLMDYWPLGRLQLGREAKSRGQGLSVGRLIIEKIPLLILAAVSSVITYIVQKHGGAVRPIDSLPLNLRTANALVSYISYIGKMIYPRHLAVFYPHQGRNLPMWQAIVCFIILAVVSWGIIYVARRRRYLTVGWLWYVGTLVPVIGLVQVGGQAIADRYTYLPLIGIFIMVAWGVDALPARWPYRKLVLGIPAGVVLFTMLICTRNQVQYWQNNLTLFGHAVEVTENNYVMHNNYGAALREAGRIDEAMESFVESLRLEPRYPNTHNNLGLLAQSQGYLDEAISHYRQALRYDPDDAKAFNNLGIALQAQGKIDEAISCYQRALQIAPRDTKALNNLGIALQAQDKYDEAIGYFRQAFQINEGDVNTLNNLGLMLQTQGKIDEAISHFRRALQIKPDNTKTHNKLGSALHAKGEFDEAISHYREALRIEPDDAKVHRNLGLALQAQSRLEEAINHFTKAVQLKPDSASAHYTLARALTRSGKTSEAIKHFKEALRLEADWVMPMNSLAWLLATHHQDEFRNPEEAVRLAERACELTNNENTGCVDTLAAAYAAAGRFPKAVTTAEKAIELAGSGDDEERVEKMRKRLELYKGDQSYRETPRPMQMQPPKGSEEKK